MEDRAGLALMIHYTSGLYCLFCWLYLYSFAVSCCCFSLLFFCLSAIALPCIYCTCLCVPAIALPVCFFVFSFFSDHYVIARLGIIIAKKS